MIKRIYFLAERAVGKAMGYRKIQVTEMKSGMKFIRRVSHDQIQNIIKDPGVRSVRFLE